MQARALTLAMSASKLQTMQSDVGLNAGLLAVVKFHDPPQGDKSFSNWEE
jgi:hypothetical protein